jgi:prepilin-type N-terminal cleavage/methylation domain-containing protein
VHRSNRGFTLIEISIALVIVGLLLGGVFVGSELVAGARVKSLAQDFRSVPTYLYAYQDQHKALPGDDPWVAAKLPGAALAQPEGLRGNGRIDSAWNSAFNTDESRLLWQHLRLAGLATGPTSVDDPLFIPRNVLGGALGLSSLQAAQAQITGMVGEYQICSGGIPGRVARQLDATLDDGETSAGNVRAVPEGAAVRSDATASRDLEESRVYTVCMTF